VPTVGRERSHDRVAGDVTVMSPPAARRGQVLVAEDDVRLGRLLAQSLTKADRTPTGFDSGANGGIEYGGLLADAQISAMSLCYNEFRARSSADKFGAPVAEDDSHPLWPLHPASDLASDRSGHGPITSNVLRRHPIPDLKRTNRPQRKGNLHDSRGKPNPLMDRSPTAARPASRRAIGIRNGEHDT
jgi:hypothetical protein